MFLFKKEGIEKICIYIFIRMYVCIYIRVNEDVYFYIENNGRIKILK